jgi:BirA family biotin operon repressor/biotin-[acetyl-CoA-carboxylase] ligase
VKSYQKKVKMIGSNIIELNSTKSTNNYANGLLSENETPDGTVVLAYEQTAGRGQLTNFWESEPRMNLTFSIVVYPSFLEISRQFMLSKVVTLGVYSALNKYVDNLRIKWPNDIYAGNKKLGGVLIENSIMGGLIKSAVIGVGINVNQTIFRSNAPNPVSLKILTNQHFDCRQILDEILSSIDFYYSILKSSDEARIDDEFIQTLFRINEKHWFRSENQNFEGEIIGVNEIGQLLIKASSGEIREFHFKEVEFLYLA